MKQVLDAVLDTMLPGGDGFPGGAGSAEWLMAQARFGPALQALAAALPDGFVALSPDARTQALKAAEADIPEVFDAATIALYSAYYTRPDVLAAIEAARGYKAVPPQPGGYELPAFDPDILAVPMARDALWRDPNAKASR